MAGLHRQREALLRNGTQILSWALTVTLAAAYLRPSILFTWHPFFMSLGYLGLMTDGIVRAIDFRPLEKSERVGAIQRHMYVQVLGTLSIAAGFYAIYLNKARMGKPHFMSLHGKLGLAAAVLSAVSAAMGATSFRKLGIITRFPEHMHRSIKMFHRVLGTGTWVLALSTIMLGLPHPAVNKGSLTILWQASVVSLFGLVVYRLYQTQQQPTISMSEYELVEQGQGGAAAHQTAGECNESRSKAK